MTDDPDVRIANSLMDYLFRRLAIEYLDPEDRAAIGIFTTDERRQPTLPGVEEAATISNPGHDLIPEPRRDVAADTAAASHRSVAVSAPSHGSAPVGRPDASAFLRLAFQRSLRVRAV